MNNDAGAYKAAIDILMSGPIDYRAVVTSLAKEEPAIFLRLVGQGEFPAWTRDAAALLMCNERVEGIKCIRAGADLGLFEAKQVIDFTAWALTQENLGTPEVAFSNWWVNKRLNDVLDPQTKAAGVMLVKYTRSEGLHHKMLALLAGNITFIPTGK